VHGEILLASAEAQDLAVHVPMRDGVRIAVDVYLPKAAPAKSPALLELTRYWRSRENTKGQPVDSLDGLDRAFLAHDYAVVKVDVRGTGASFGHRVTEYGPDEVQDGRDIVAWVAAQPWCDGNVGAYGTSYSGTTADLLTSSQHPALKAVVVGWSDFDVYTSPARPYGLFAESLIRQWSDIVHRLDQNEAGAWGASVRRVQGDNDGALLAAAVAEHATNVDVAAMVARATFRDQEPAGGGVSLLQCSALHWQPAIEASKVPMLVFASWLDSGTAAGALARLQQFRNPQHLVILASNHGGGVHASPFTVSGEPVPPVPSQQEQVQLRLDFFDQHLRRQDRGVASWPKVRYFNFGEEQMAATATWPPAGTANRTFWCDADHRLARSVPATGRDDYDVDFGVTTGRANRWATQMGTPVFHLDHREAMDARLLLYTGEPLAADLQVTGTPVLHLWCAADRDDGAFLAYLEDVDADGRSRYVTEGGLRGLHRKPAASGPVPAHSFAAGDAMPLVPGEVCELAFALQPISVRLPRGHRLRLALAGADRDSFARVPAAGAVHWRVERGGEHATRLELPVVAH
jgi:hypothetical protein